MFPPVDRLIVRRQEKASDDGLIVLRRVFMSFCVAIALFGIVSVLIGPPTELRQRTPKVALGLLIAGGLSVVGGTFFERPLDCADERRLAGTYRTRFFMRMGFSESAALLGFMGYFMTAEPWVYPAAAGVTSLGFSRAAPTRGRLRRDQDRLDATGCAISLVQALRVSRSGPSRG